MRLVCNSISKTCNLLSRVSPPCYVTSLSRWLRYLRAGDLDEGAARPARSVRIQANPRASLSPSRAAVYMRRAMTSCKKGARRSNRRGGSLRELPARASRSLRRTYHRATVATLPANVSADSQAIVSGAIARIWGNHLSSFGPSLSDIRGNDTPEDVFEAERCVRMLFYWMKNGKKLPVTRLEDVSGMLKVVHDAATQLTNHPWFRNVAETDSTNRYVKWWAFVLRVAQQMVLNTEVTALDPFLQEESAEAPAGLTDLWYARRLVRAVHRRVSRLPAIQRLAGKFLYGDFKVLCTPPPTPADVVASVVNPIRNSLGTSLKLSDLGNQIGVNKHSLTGKADSADTPVVTN